MPNCGKAGNGYYTYKGTLVSTPQGKRASWQYSANTEVTTSSNCYCTVDDEGIAKCGTIYTNAVITCTTAPGVFTTYNVNYNSPYIASATSCFVSEVGGEGGEMSLNDTPCCIVNYIWPPNNPSISGCNSYWNNNCCISSKCSNSQYSTNCCQTGTTIQCSYYNNQTNNGIYNLNITGLPNVTLYND